LPKRQELGIIKVDGETRPGRNAWENDDINELDTLDLLLEAGAGLNAKALFKGSDVTPLDLATTNKYTAVVQRLLLHGAKSQDASIALAAYDAGVLPTLLETKDSDVVTKVVEVIKENDYATIKEFVRRGGSLMAKGQHPNHTTLYCIVDLGRISLLTVFEEEVLKVDQQRWIKESGTVGILLTRACERSLPSLHIVKHLIEKAGLDQTLLSHIGICPYSEAKVTSLHLRSTLLAYGGRHLSPGSRR
jgi:hypothetical protein